MKAAVLEDWGQISVRDAARPDVGAGECLLRVSYAGVCGSDVHIYQGTNPIATTPVIPGHEFAGTVVEYRGEPAEPLEIGQQVAVHPLVSCGSCPTCRSGDLHLCQTLTVIGVNRDGGFAEYVRVPLEKVIPLSPDIPATAAPLGASGLVWQILGIVSTTGWLLTLAYLWRTRQQVSAESPESPAALTEQRAYKLLLNACTGNDAHAARAALIAWTAALPGQQGLVTLEQVISQFNDAQLASELQVLDCSLYSPARDDWSGTGLAECVQRLRGEQRQGSNKHNAPLQLYPQTS